MVSTSSKTVLLVVLFVALAGMVTLLVIRLKNRESGTGGGEDTSGFEPRYLGCLENTDSFWNTPGAKYVGQEAGSYFNLALKLNERILPEEWDDLDENEMGVIAGHVNGQPVPAIPFAHPINEPLAGNYKFMAFARNKGDSMNMGELMFFHGFTTSSPPFSDCGDMEQSCHDDPDKLCGCKEYDNNTCGTSEKIWSVYQLRE